jgi:hypothetical protein
LGHPDKDVDLCVFPFTHIEQALQQKGANPFYCALKEHNIPSNDELANLNIVEDVLMVGYPVALWDAVHKQPIFRKGSTATDPATKFDGKPEFLIDMACWPGSSGSPVCIADHGGFVQRDGKRVERNRSLLLGILYAGPFFQPIPNVTALKQFINIGKVLRSSLLLDIKAVIAREHPPPKDGVVQPSNFRVHIQEEPTR